MAGGWFHHLTAPHATTAEIATTGAAIAAALDQMGNMSREQVRDARAAKFLSIGRKI